MVTKHLSRSLSSVSAALCLLVATPSAARSQQCTGGGWSPPAEVRGPAGRPIMMGASSAITIGDNVLTVGSMALEWLVDDGPFPTDLTSPEDSRKATILGKLDTMAGFVIDPANRATPAVRATAGPQMSEPRVSAAADGRVSMIWSHREPGVLGDTARQISRLHVADWRNGRFENERAVLPEAQREFSADGAITAGGSPGQRVVSVNDVYPRYGGGLEALLAHETATGWMYRRYTATRNLSGIQSVVRLDASDDIVLLGVLEGGGAGFRITSWRIPADSVRSDIRPYTLGRGTQLANLGNDMTDFPRIFAIGGDSVAAVWYASARQAPSTGATLDMTMGSAEYTLTVQLSGDGGLSWSPSLTTRIAGGISRPILLRDGRGGLHLFYSASGDGRVIGGPSGTQHFRFGAAGAWVRESSFQSEPVWVGPLVTATRDGLVALWSVAEVAGMERMELRQPRLRIARYVAPSCR
jgi:hypothetical protein